MEKGMAQGNKKSRENLKEISPMTTTSTRTRLPLAMTLTGLSKQGVAPIPSLALPKPRKLILSNRQSPGDIVMLTAAVRDLHRCYPGRFITDIRTPSPDLWQHNPYITPLSETAKDVTVVKCEYPLIHQSNTRPYHFIHAFMHNLNEQLGLNIQPTEFKGDIYISDEEKQWFDSVEDTEGQKERPFWLMVSGGKTDFTIKWWDDKRYQQVVDHFAGKIEFVQVGDGHHYHPPLNGTIDLRGQTSIRHLVRLMYHAQGVLTPVSFPMHLAAAVPTKPGAPPVRPCVVIGGGREPVQWAAYSYHQYIHTIGQLDCCATGGCWRSRTAPLGDGEEHDAPHRLCLNVVNKSLPRCMDMITADEVIRRIEGYFTGGIIPYLS
jgi:ADP-heptose:LPS heptosyltransferase